MRRFLVTVLERGTHGECSMGRKEFSVETFVESNRKSMLQIHSWLESASGTMCQLCAVTASHCGVAPNENVN